MEDSPLNDYILSYNGIFEWFDLSTELVWYLSIETALAITAIYTIAGFLMFVINRRWKYIFLPFLYALLGAGIGIIDGCILCNYLLFL